LDREVVLRFEEELAHCGEACACKGDAFRRAYGKSAYVLVGHCFFVIEFDVELSGVGHVVVDHDIVPAEVTEDV